jgi:CHASE domain
MEAITFAPLVKASQVAQWETFSVAHQDWIQASRQTFIDHIPAGRDSPVYLPGEISPYIYHRRDDIFAEPSVTTDEEHNASSSLLFAPAWYMSPPPMNPGIVNLDIFSRPKYSTLLQRVIKNGTAILSPFVDNVQAMLRLQVSDTDHLLYHEQFNSVVDPKSVGYDQPQSLYAQPVFETTKNQKVVGMLMGVTYLATLLPNGRIFGLVLSTIASCSR